LITHTIYKTKDMNKLELDNGSLVWQPTKVIYKDKEYPAPVFLTTLLSMDYITNLLKSGDWKK